MTLIYMERNNLDNIPQYELPEGFSFSYYEEGNEQDWIDIHLVADIYNKANIELYRKSFGNDVKLLSERQCFIVNENGEKIGTATAWFNDNYFNQKWGRIHWVAIKPEYQGKGLAKPLLSEIMNKLKMQGHNNAYLTTRALRIPALNLYLKYGFYPKVNNDEELESWRDVKEKLPDYPWDNWQI